MLLPLDGKPAVSPALLAALLNIDIADQAFRCLSGSVAVSAYEMEALPLPDPKLVAGIQKLILRKATRVGDRRESMRQSVHIIAGERMKPLPLLPSVTTIQDRLRRIFPEGTPNRNYCTREIAAKTIFVMLYAGAIQSSDSYLRPNQVTRMTDAQAARTGDEDRVAWTKASLIRQESEIPGRWYAVDTREPIRDETLRDGLVRIGAVVVRSNVATTSSIPRYALTDAFAALFDAELEGPALVEAIGAWQAGSLSASALARIQLIHRGVVASQSGIMITFPNGETRRLAAGPSSVIAKAVVEEFAPRFLHRPGVIFLSESGDKVVAQDEKLARSLNLKIPADKYLPDLLLVDLGPEDLLWDPLLVFVEVVATDGPINQSRLEALWEIVRAAGFDRRHVAFVTAYLDRGQAAFRKTAPELAWQSFAWFAAEPDGIIVLHEGRPAQPSRLVDFLNI